MKLFSYDHCPYCVKARMIFGIKNIPFEHKIILNDDAKTPISMVGKKMVPILERGEGDCLPESMDIIAWCDAQPEFGAPLVKPSRGDDRLKKWLTETRRYNYGLAMPRWIKMGLPEFSTVSAAQYFEEKKQASIGPFDANVLITESLIKMAEDHLQQLESLVNAEGPWFWGQELTEDDFHVFAALRVLTTVKGLKFPDKINKYACRISERANVPLHWDLALGVDFE